MATYRSSRPMPGAAMVWVWSTVIPWVRAIVVAYPSSTCSATEDADAATVRPPASARAGHVELGYATTLARTQGMTVDQTHTIAAPGMGREDLYVAMSRGRHLNRTY